MRIELVHTSEALRTSPVITSPTCICCYYYIWSLFHFPPKIKWRKSTEQCVQCGEHSTTGQGACVLSRMLTGWLQPVAFTYSVPQRFVLWANSFELDVLRCRGHIHLQNGLIHCSGVSRFHFLGNFLVLLNAYTLMEAYTYSLVLFWSFVEKQNKKINLVFFME